MKVKRYNNEKFGDITVVIKDGVEYLIAKEIASKVGYVDAKQAIRDHVDEEDKIIVKLETKGGLQDTILINESGFYSLVLRSKLDSVKPFKRWVTSEVLPSIRKTGIYLTESVRTEIKEKGLEESLTPRINKLEKFLEDKNKQIKYLENVIENNLKYIDALTTSSSIVDLNHCLSILSMDKEDFVYSLLDLGILKEVHKYGGAFIGVEETYENEVYLEYDYYDDIIDINMSNVFLSEIYLKLHN